jgi:pyrimidine-nucleoside phosphorylase
VTAPLSASALIRRKRDGGALAPAELAALVAGITDGSVPDYQTAAFLMAVFFRGFSAEELAAWTDAMVRSGEVLALAGVGARKVDKHSTGGVGDKISLPLAPAVAACGVAVPMVSGRGLGHTGGTLDKLESIPGFTVNLPTERFAAQVAEIGACLIGQTEHLAPADRKLYALRDVTGTIESIPLIASSIMSKKLAEGIDGLVLDVKVGSGAFMKRAADARALAETLCGIGRAAGKQVTALLTDMNQPIGRAVGNANEVAESIAVLQGGGPADTRALTVALGAEMLVLGGAAATPAEGAARIAAVLDDGSALEKMRQIVRAQGGDPRVCDRPEEVLPARAPDEGRASARRGGFVVAVDAEAVGRAVVLLGGGRQKKEDRIDPSVGVEVLVRLGDAVAEGETLALAHGRGDLGAALAELQRAYVIGDAPVAPPALVQEVLR